MQVINNTNRFILLQKLRKLVGIISIILPCVILCSQQAVAASKAPVIKVAVASNFLLPLKYLKADFEAQSTVKIKITSASTAKLYAQIINGAPFNVFLSADNVAPQKLIERRVATIDGAFQYARGQLVLWTVKSNIKTVDTLQQRFLKSEFSRLALANPKTAPYGKAAMEVIAHYHVNTNRAKLILGESVGQAYQFTGSGNVDMGFVAFSQIKSRQLQGRHLRFWALPVDTYDPIIQQGIILTKHQQSTAAKAFVRYLKSPRVQLILKEKFGYL